MGMGSLHERNVSYWVATTGPTDYPRLEDGRRTEVAVLGGGITGLTTAYLLSREGVAVTVIEAGRIAAGVTGYTTGKLTTQHRLIYKDLLAHRGEADARAYADAQTYGLETVAGIIAHDGIECDLTRMAAYVYTEDPGQVPRLQEEADVAAGLGLPASFVTSIDLPWEVAGALRFDNQAVFHPRKYCLALARAIVARGGVIAERTRALGVDDADPCVVQTDRGTLRARAVVVATHVPFMANGAFFARMQPHRSYAVAAPSDSLPDAMYISAEEPTRSIRPHPSVDGDVLIVGGDGHPSGQESDTTRFYDEIAAWADERLVLGPPAWRWSAQDFATADRTPFIGPITPGSPNTFIATGYAKWGMTSATVAARLITDAIVGRENPWAHTFDPTHRSHLRTIGTVASQGLETAKSIVIERTGAALSSRSIEDLSPGEGAVVRMEGESVAAFRQEDGSVCALSAVCTHMGCLVHFNDAERSWDCPCHGSRFDLDGHVLSGPATKDLARKAALQESQNM